MPAQDVIAPNPRAGMFLVYTVDEGKHTQVADVLTDISSLNRAVGFRSPGEDLTLVVGIGADLWDRIWGEDTRPAQLHVLPEVAGARHTAPSTPGDLLVHIRGQHIDVCFEMAKVVADKLDGLVTAVDEVHGFRFYGDRDLLGFVDGTENPEAGQALAAVTIGAEDPGYAGGSYVVIQKYLHDMAAWSSLSVEAQERVIGRTKLEDIELSDHVKPRNSHVAANTVYADDGTQLQIVRENMPFGSITKGEFGTFFIGYARDPRITETMLRNMFVGRPEGNTDAILEFSTAHTGCLFFVPSGAWLDDPAPVRRGEQPPAPGAELPMGNQPGPDGPGSGPDGPDALSAEAGGAGSGELDAAGTLGIGKPSG